MLATNLDLLGSITSIIESYFLLDAVHILRVSVIILISYLLADSTLEPVHRLIQRLSQCFSQ